MMPKEPMRGATLFSHANKMTQAYHIMLTPLCKETGLPPLALDILLFLANNPEGHLPYARAQTGYRLRACGKTGE